MALSTLESLNGLEKNRDLFLPEPDRREVVATIISVDDHVIEPPDTFVTRVPKHLVGRVPHVVELENGHQVWEFDGRQVTQSGANAVAGRKQDRRHAIDAFRFDEMRPGCFDINARVKDMDVNGVWASMNFPSQISGFCGRVFFGIEDRELGVACIKAWNDWLYEDWHTQYPERIIPMGIAYLADQQLAVAEIHRMAELGFKAISMPERPHRIGLPSLWDREYWDPIIGACAETELVIALHIGSSGMIDLPPGYDRETMGFGLSTTMFPQMSFISCAEWLWSEWPLRYPNLKIALSEGGIGWVAMLLDRLDNIVDRSGLGGYWNERPADVVKRNFWFCTIDDPSTIDTRHRIGVENIMFEVDYPHGDSTWPNSQKVITDAWGHIPAGEIRMMCSENAAKLFRHPLPPVVLPL